MVSTHEIVVSFIIPPHRTWLTEKPIYATLMKDLH